MTPLKIAGWLFVAYIALLALAVGAAVLPVAVCAVLWLVYKRDWKLGQAFNHVRAKRTVRSAGPFIVILVFSILETIALSALPSSFSQIKSGVSPFSSAITITMLFVVIAALAYVFDQIAKGALMKNIFDVMDDRALFEEFAAADSDSPVVIEIDPEQLRAQIKSQVIV